MFPKVTGSLVGRNGPTYAPNVGYALKRPSMAVCVDHEAGAWRHYATQGEYPPTNTAPDPPV